MTQAIPNVMKLEAVKQRIEAGLLQYQERKADASYLGACLPVIDAIDEWKFATGPLYDPPRYQMQLMGFSASKPLKKNYASVDEARVAGVYSAGFIQGEYRITVGPTKPLSLS